MLFCETIRWFIWLLCVSGSHNWTRWTVSIESSFVVVKKLFSNLFNFLFIEKFDVLIDILHPRMSIYFMNCNSLIWISIQHSFNQISCLFWYCVFERKFGFKNQSMEIIHSICFKWNCTIKHCIKNNSSTPNICLKSIIALISKYFWSNICRRSTLLSHLFF